ncbi:NADP-dependent 3-hydroxy acid dehydrogenase YdfG [Streptomyces sp. TLI_55]|uniref:SDR family NAD(P)-dependent oxidoreductase n=1 Tax=Streptomyces sp. TLI_55 TaxID=1938861 RepID=UPI000BC418E7|nr:SDR family NAD(P)-dependent oxidoreductase [Streptomyces sp. TLI_55]SNX61928.1 NADP-dependent 3-hydroxy acid dehydrogenase YdfG [Streptomyces sp. TLI_55]
MSPTSSAPVALVTGAAGGLGSATIKKLSDAGWQVIAAVRTPEALSALPLGLAAVTPVVLDVTDPDSIQAAATTVAPVLADHGLDALVNNAGVIVQGPVELVPPHALRRQFEINVLGQIAVTQAFLPALRRAGGRVVNVGAVTARTAVPFFGPVAASKAALASLNDTLRLELKFLGVDVVLVEPGALETEIFHKADKAAADDGWAGDTEARQRYVKALGDAQAAAAKQKATPVEKAAGTLTKAITTRRPATRYLIGQDARALSFLRILPDRFRDGLLLRTLGLSRASYPKPAESAHAR